MKKSLKQSARYAAIETLFTLKKTRLPVKQLFQKFIDDYDLQVKDRQLAMNFIYGVLRQRQYLDSLLEILCRQPLNRIKPRVYQALSVGLYQIFFLDRIPESAAVNETVNSLKAAGTPAKLTGFVNGVLRASIRQKDSLPKPKIPQEITDILNHPKWMTDRWQKYFGDENTVQICASNHEEPQLTLRANSSLITRSELIKNLTEQNIDAITGKYATESIILPTYRGAIDALPGFSQGHFQVQDQAAQLSSLLLGPFKSGGNYLDACAGLGGKTSHLAELISTTSDSPLTDVQLVALEPEEGRFCKLQENLARLPYTQTVSCLKSTIEDFSETNTTLYDGVMIDAPCSGTGVTGRHPDIRWNRQVEDIEKYTKTQLSLLRLAAKIVKPGGVLLYATCSIEPEENSGVIEIFLQEYPQFTQSNCGDFLPDSATQLLRDGCLAPIHTEGIDGFFATRLVYENV